jgi:hypothetical protein
MKIFITCTPYQMHNPKPEVKKDGVDWAPITHEREEEYIKSFGGKSGR